MHRGDVQGSVECLRAAIDEATGYRARANPAPQEPTARGELPEHAQESGWQHDAAKDLYWRGDREEPCGLVEFCDRVGVVTVEGDVQADDLAAILAHRLRTPADPPAAPHEPATLHPTSADKPQRTPTMMVGPNDARLRNPSPPKP